MKVAHKTSDMIPPEIIAARRQRRTRTLRLYAIAVGVIFLLVLGILVVYGSFFSAGIATGTRFSNAFNAASNALIQGDYRTAEREMRDAIAIRDGYNVRYDLGVILLKAGRYDAASAQFHKAISFKQDSDAYWYAAVAALAMHRPAIARLQARKALAINPIIGEYRAALAMSEQELGHTALAAQEFVAARSADGYTGQTIQQWIAAAQFVQTSIRPANGGTGGDG